MINRAKTKKALKNAMNTIEKTIDNLARKSWDIETQRKENIEYPKNNDKIFNVKTNKIRRIIRRITTRY